MLWHLEYDDYNLYFDNRSQSELNEIIKDIKSNNCRKLIIIHIGNTSNLTSNHKKIIEGLLCNIKKYNANIVIQTKKYSKAQFKCEPIYVNYDSTKMKDNMTTLIEDCKNSSTRTIVCLEDFLETHRGEFLNWFLKTKLFE